MCSIYWEAEHSHWPPNGNPKVSLPARSYLCKIWLTASVYWPHTAHHVGGIENAIAFNSFSFCNVPLSDDKCSGNLTRWDLCSKWKIKFTFWCRNAIILCFDNLSWDKYFMNIIWINYILNAFNNSKLYSCIMHMCSGEYDNFLTEMPANGLWCFGTICSFHWNIQWLALHFIVWTITPQSNHVIYFKAQHWITCKSIAEVTLHIITMPNVCKH